ncbi:unnamed protein product [Penicillium nalgiovense]|uniref:RanBD1 domain-containing protein n=1 Tax=Penicillium nalgiovense TaxID=60175 RepID=A0A9W4HLE6_PENNA|nr:unnamed protein product [Penicillium nalgiovense]CAG7980860.1 unnamed protein product [Penicillium nalgiovense]CAG7989719.1 unnamed protein product [Penicillium nalgiovense]CAG8018435.1 unnamed protein product [Penicillium nalgiovense]CAG8033305.1 unnamed protein product [Penicillium nalgiovense]
MSSLLGRIASNPPHTWAVSLTTSKLITMDRTVTAQSPASDNDSGERPVRQQLKQTNLDAMGENNISTRSTRKRSLDNTDGATDAPPIKRSRECTPDITAPAADNSKHAAIPRDATTQDVSADVLATAPVSTSVHNTRLSHNPIMSHIPETKVQFPLGLEIKVSIGGFEQISHVTVPVEIGIKVTAGAVTLASSTSNFTEGESSKIHVTIPSAKPTPPSGTPSSGAPPPGTPSSGAPPHGARSPGAPSPSALSPGAPPLAQTIPDYLRPDQPLPEELKDESFHIFEEPESIGDSSSEDSLPDYRSTEYPSSPPVPYSPTHPDCPRPSVEVPEVLGSNHSQSPQNLGTTGGNENDSSQPEKKRPRDNSEERKAKVDQTFTASAFGKASANPSPFAMPNKSTSDASPFATKGAPASGFGGLGSGFSAFGSAFPAPSGKLTSFASPNAPAAFSGTAGKLTSFASPNAPAAFSGTAGKLTSFASPNAPVSLAESSDKTLGAKQSDNEESDNEPVGEPDDTFVAEKTDERFHAQTGMDPALLPFPWTSPWTPNMARDSYRSEQSVETGEENETTEFSAKGKLYGFDDKKWRERGAGTFKVNLKTESDGKKSGRIIMRADGALRVMLNSAIWQTMPFGDIKGSRPTTRDIYLASKEEEKVVSLLLRLGNEQQAQNLYDVLKNAVQII